MSGYKSTFEHKLIYVFRINDENHKGLLKIGDATIHTDKPTSSLFPNCKDLNMAAKARIDTYTKTASVAYELLYTELAIRTVCKDGVNTIKSFRDKDVHRVLMRSGISRYEFGITDSDKWIEKICSTPIFVYAPIHTLRQQNQRGRYILFPNKIEPSIFDAQKKQFSSIIEPIHKNDPCIKLIINIPAASKDSLLSELKLYGVSRDFLFADSVDETCNTIKQLCFGRIS